MRTSSSDLKSCEWLFNDILLIVGRTKDRVFTAMHRRFGDERKSPDFCQYAARRGGSSAGVGEDDDLADRLHPRREDAVRAERRDESLQTRRASDFDRDGRRSARIGRFRHPYRWNSMRFFMIVVNFDAPSSVDVYVHRIGRTCRSESATGLAISLFSSRDKQFVHQLCAYLRSLQQPIPAALAALGAGGATEKKTSHRGSGLGFDSQTEANLASARDAFEGYFQEEKGETKGTVISHSATGYQTVYDPVSNTYTTTLAPGATANAGMQGRSASNVAGFVAGRSQKDALPVSSYGGPDDEWDSSVMALESALAAIQARRREEERNQSHRSRSRSESRRSRSRSRSRSRRSRSRNRSRSRSRSRRSRSRSRSRRSRSHRHYSQDRHGDRDHRRSHHSRDDRRSHSHSRSYHRRH